MAILSTSDFVDRPYRVLNQSESQDFGDFIADEEKKILIGILGYELWKELDEALDASNLSAALTALKDGGEYTCGDVLYKYEGLKDLLKPAVYSRWIEQGAYKFTAAGWVENQPQQNSTVIDPEPFIVRYWNEYVEKVGVGFNQKGGTFYGFMMANEDDYPDWEFTEQKTKNRFGL